MHVWESFLYLEQADRVFLDGLWAGLQMYH